MAARLVVDLVPAARTQAVTGELVDEGSYLEGLRIVLDVQHAFKLNRPLDRGAVFDFGAGRQVTEVDLVLNYVASAADTMRRWGAEVLTNDLERGILVGYYSQRARSAAAWGAHAYLACHVNAGRGSYARVGYLAPPLPTAAREPLAVEPIAGHVLGAISGALAAVITHPQIVCLTPSTRGYGCISRVPPSIQALLVEPFFGDNPDHQVRIGSSVGLAELGVAIAEGVYRWWQVAADEVPVIRRPRPAA